MRIGIGVSTGTEVVCAALVVEEDDGSRTVEYRTISRDSEVNTDAGDLVASAIELMASLAPARPGAGTEPRVPDVVAVTHRTQDQANSVRSALARSKRTAVLVPEAAAGHAFLDDAGLIARYRAVVIVDVGATGTTASVVDTASGVLLAEDRTEHFSGDVVDRIVKDLVHGGPAADRAMRDDLRDDRGMGSARYRTVKEHLSAHDVAEVRSLHGTSTIDRAAFDLAVRPYVTTTARFTERTAASSASSPEAVVLIGGGATVPVVRAEFDATLPMAVLAPAEPDTVLAAGAAHLALNGHTGGYPTVGLDANGNTRSLGRFSGALVGALLVGGIVVAYGVQTLAPNDRSSVSPAGSAASTPEPGVDLPIANVDGTDAVDISTRTTGRPVPATGTTPIGPSGVAPTPTTRPSATPSLHPAPDLPVIPWPASPQLSTGVTTETSTTPRPSVPGPGTTDPVTTPPITTPPGGSTDVPPTDVPGESTTPDPGSGESTELSPPPLPSVGVPTTDVNAVPPPSLSPPETVWTPPPSPSAGVPSTAVPTTAVPSAALPSAQGQPDPTPRSQAPVSTNSATPEG